MSRRKETTALRALARTKKDRQVLTLLSAPILDRSPLPAHGPDPDPLDKSDRGRGQWKRTADLVHDPGAVHRNELDQTATRLLRTGTTGAVLEVHQSEHRPAEETQTMTVTTLPRR